MNWLKKISMHKTLIIARGPSGSGKSMMSRILAEKFNAPIFASDDFWMNSGEYQFDPDYIGESHFWNHGRAEEAMQGNEPVIIIDNTNVQFWEMRKYAIMAQEYGYSVVFKEPDWDPRLKTPEGRWNVNFLEEMQNQPDREKKVPLQVLELMVDKYEYNPTMESVLNSKKPF